MMMIMNPIAHIHRLVRSLFLICGITLCCNGGEFSVQPEATWQRWPASWQFRNSVGYQLTLSHNLYEQVRFSLAISRATTRKDIPTISGMEAVDVQIRQLFLSVGYPLYYFGNTAEMRLQLGGGIAQIGQKAITVDAGALGSVLIPRQQQTNLASAVGLCIKQSLWKNLNLTFTPVWQQYYDRGVLHQLLLMGGVSLAVGY